VLFISGFVLLNLRCFVAAVLVVFLLRQGLAPDYFSPSVSHFVLPLRARAPRVVRLASALYFPDRFLAGQVSALDLARAQISAPFFCCVDAQVHIPFSFLPLYLPPQELPADLFFLLSSSLLPPQIFSVCSTLRQGNIQSSIGLGIDPCG
jgi:hypothetical protein